MHRAVAKTLATVSISAGALGVMLAPADASPAPARPVAAQPIADSGSGGTGSLASLPASLLWDVFCNGSVVGGGASPFCVLVNSITTGSAK
ncbi:hypothetical protein [Nocardia sp. NBC_01388]|uniref:hypothetical protein n=1 Tax=Nocardia sp. NBC_01388 TaxID=2903596 RepID=UPI00324AF453